LEGLYEFCSGSNSLDLRFTYFDSHDSDSVSGPFLFDTIGYPGHGAQAPEDTTYSGTARIRNHFKYYAGDATINRLAFDVCPDNLTFLFGLQYVYVGFKRNFKSRGTFLSDGVKPLNNRLHESSRFWGIGPEIGIDYNYFFELYKCFGHFAFNARARGALLCSCIRTNFHYRSERTGSVGVNLHNDRLWRVNPTIDAQLGLSYHACCCGMQTFLEVGYDFIWCNKCIDKITGYDVAFAGDTFDILETLSLQGPFVALGIAF
jgi:hypothetical protein